MSEKEKLNERKEALKAELNNIEEEMDRNFNEVKSEVSTSLNPLEYVRRYPLPLVGVTALIGLLIGANGGSTGSASPRESTNSSSGNEKITATVWYELKRLAARKALSRVGDFLEAIF